MTCARVAGIGVLGPGLDGWKGSALVLRGETAYVPFETELAPPAHLSPRERRRTGLTSRLALNVAEEAVAQSGIPAQELSPVFATANGDGQTIHELLESCVTPGKSVSPTVFHNSVHNAAVGYWAIGACSQAPSTCVAAHDFTFAAALLKSLMHVSHENQPVLTVVYDAPFPEPLNGARPLYGSPFGLALVLTPVEMESGLAELRLLGLQRGPGDISRPRNPDLIDLWAGNPAARGLPALEVLAGGRPTTLVLEYTADQHLRLEIAPC